MVFESRSEAESEVVGFLRKHLKAPYEVIPSTDYASISDDRRLQAGEFDALVFHPAKGILIIEVKGGGVGYDGKSRKWYSVDHEREKHLIKEVAALHARVLYPTCCVLPTLKSQIAREEAAFVTMTEEQKGLLDLISDTRQVAIKGYAGSGKTLLAVEKARRLYHDGLKVAVLCFNRPLADDIRRTLVDCSDRVDVNSFHGLCWKLCEDAGIDVGGDSG